MKASETYAPIADFFGLSDDERTRGRRFPDGRYEPEWNNRVQWVRERLCRDGLLKRPPEARRGQWALTQEGVTAARTRVHAHAQLLPPTLEADDLAEPRPRHETTIYRVLRDSALARMIKALHGHRCQLCGETIALSSSILYAEAHHVRPLGRPHNGPDIPENLLCLCPNHHVELDYGAIRLVRNALRTINEHDVGDEFIAYHNRVIFRGDER